MRWITASRRTVLLCATITASVTVALSVTLGSVVAGVCGPSWRTVPSSPEIAVPRDIVAVAPNDVWIVGRKAPGNQGIPTGIEHWDGTGWTLSPSPSAALGPSAENVLNGADALNTNNVWAVGYSKNAASYGTLVEQWNGSRWSVVPSPNAGTGASVLLSVDALRADLAWAVGYYRQDSARRALLMRWNGTGWSVVPSPNPGTLSNSLLGVAAIAPNDIWAVGYKSSGNGYRSLILHYNGAAWSEVSVPAYGTGDNVLTGISAVSGKEAWAVGYYVEGTQHRPLTLRYDGTAWRRVPGANTAGGVTVLRDVDAYSSNDAWAVGFEYQSDRGRYVASSQHWNGTSWRVFPSAIRAKGGSSEMLGVARAPATSQVWGAGPYAATSGAVGDVETICTSTSATAPASVPDTDASTTAFPSAPSEATRQPVSDPGASVGAAASPIPVRAVDRAPNAGISEVTRTHGAVIDDLDNDGLEDIFLGRHGLAPRLYANDGNGHFNETHQGTFRTTDRHGCDAADVNQDGLKDLFCTEGAAYGTQAKRNALYIQRPDGSFVDRAALYGVLEPFSRGRGGTFLRANGDAFPDLYVANERERADGMPSSNRLFLNQGGSAYRYASGSALERELGDGEDTGSDSVVADVDKDGWQDLLLQTDSGLRLYRNAQGTRFTDVTGSAGIGQGAVDAILADVNGDTWPDIIKVSATQLSVLRNTNGHFSPTFSAPLSSGLAVAAGDVNGDARPDLYVMQAKSGTSANAPDRVYLNDGTGGDFSSMSSVPSTSQGAAESVWPIDHDGNGLTDFLVLNGNLKTQGPVQLISFFPAS